VAEFIKIIKSAGPSAGGLAIAAYGVVGGQFAAKFKVPFDDYASVGCLAAMVVGLCIAIWRAIKS
jgi:hypothetical protein